MANQYYRFVFNLSPVSLTTSFQTAGDSGWTSYQEPNYTNGQVRTGGPNNANNPNGPSGNYLVVGSGDNVFIQLQGPQGWSMLSSDSQLHVIVSQANSPGSSQGFSPFSGGFVYYPITGAMLNDGVTMQFPIPSVIQPSATPTTGNYNRYELTIAFSVADSSGNAYYFADDPEMDVQGT